MPYALEFDGNGHLELDSLINYTTSDEFCIEFDVEFAASPSGDILALCGTDSGNYFYYRVSTQAFSYAFSGSSRSLGATTAQVLDQRLTIRLKSDTSGRKYFEVDGIGTSATFGSARTFKFDTLGARQSSGIWPFEGLFHSCKVYSDEAATTLVHEWNAENVSSGTQLTDLVGSNDATQSGTWPVDDSEWVSLGGGSVSLTVNELGQVQSIGSPALTQNNVLSVNSIAQTQLLSESSLTQAHNLSIDGLFQDQALTQPNLTQGGSLSVADIEQGQLLTSSILTQAHLLSVDNITQAQELISPSLVSSGSLSVDDLEQAQLLENVTLTQGFILAVSGLSQGQSVGVPDLTQGNVLIVQDLGQGQLISESGLIQRNVLVIDSITQEQVIGVASFISDLRIASVSAVFAKRPISATFNTGLVDAVFVASPVKTKLRGH